MTIFVGIAVWRWGPASFAGRQTTTKPQVVAADFGEWSAVGPPNYLNTAFAGSIWTGRVTSVAVDPADENHWLIGAAQGGVWDSRDAGATWEPRTDGQPSLAIGAIAFSPTSPNVVYPGTGEANFVGWTYAGGGRTWALLLRGEVSELVRHPADFSRQYAAIGAPNGVPGGAGPSPMPNGLYRTTDTGDPQVCPRSGSNWRATESLPSPGQRLADSALRVNATTLLANTGSVTSGGWSATT